MRLVRRNAKLAHAVENSSVYRFQTVPHVRKGTSYNDAHSIVDVGIFHFIMNFMLFHALIF